MLTKDILCCAYDPSCLIFVRDLLIQCIITSRSNVELYLNKLFSKLSRDDESDTERERIGIIQAPTKNCSLAAKETFCSFIS